MFHFPWVFTSFESPLIRKSSCQVLAILEFLFQRYLHLSVSYMVTLDYATDLMFYKKENMQIWKWETFWFVVAIPTETAYMYSKFLAAALQLRPNECNTLVLTQHCWIQHVALIWLPCCMMLNIVCFPSKSVTFPLLEWTLKKYVSCEAFNYYSCNFVLIKWLIAFCDGVI